MSQAFNWLLCNVIQTTSLHDILWHFVASLTPAPVEPEEEEDEENKANKENAEQVCTDIVTFSIAYSTKVPFISCFEPPVNCILLEGS